MENDSGNEATKNFNYQKIVEHFSEPNLEDIVIEVEDGENNFNVDGTYSEGEELNNFTYLSVDDIVRTMKENCVSDKFLELVEEKCKREDIDLFSLIRMIEKKSEAECISKFSLNKTVKKPETEFNVDVDPHSLWETLCHKYKKALDEKDYHEVVYLCRLMLNQINFEVSSGRLSLDAGLKLKENYLNIYSNIMDDVSEGGLNNYSDDIHKIADASDSQCSNWKSSLSTLSDEELFNYLPKDVQSTENISIPLSLNLESNKDDKLIKEDINAFTKRITEIVLSSPRDELEKIFGNDTAFIFSEKTSDVQNNASKIEKTIPAIFPESVDSKRKLFAYATIVQNKTSSVATSNALEEEYNRDVQTSAKSTFKRKRPSPETDIPNHPSSELSKSESMFKTAKELFCNKNDNTNKPIANSRKCLGTKRGPSSKFVTPFSRPDEDETKPKEKTEVQDERLKGIDPKMVEVMLSEIMDHDTPVTWNDIAGLEFVKTTLKEIVVWPMLRPDIFTGLRAPPKGILLFGPPGTGKTLIGKCVASQSKSTFFSISASSLGSKWYGEGEKLVRALFTVARCYQPAVIFIDEIDSLLTQRSDNDHESSRRVKTEFLVQLDGVKTTGDERLLIIGATNRPQELDEAARRRLVKRLYIPLPEPEARIQIVRTLLANHSHVLSENDFEVLKNKTAGYSGADMANLCKEAALGPIRSIDLERIASITSDQVRPITLDDFIKALNQVRASVSDADLGLYQEWNKKYGSSFT